MNGDQDPERIEMKRAIELLFSDSSKNFSDLKSREWNATYYSVLAILGSTALARGTPPALTQQRAATGIMLLIFVCHWITTFKCQSNLDVFRKRLKALIRCHFDKECHSPPLFEAGKDFEDAVVDEGSITFILYGSTLVTLLCGLYVVWQTWAFFWAGFVLWCLH
jgi:hypothetical protein